MVELVKREQRLDPQLFDDPIPPNPAFLLQLGEAPITFAECSLSVAGPKVRHHN